MIEPEWKRIAGIQCQDNGDIAAVWLAHDTQSDTIWIYAACVFEREPFAMIESGLVAQGRWIPISWVNKEISDNLLDRGLNMTHEPAPDSDSYAGVVARDIQERMRTGRFKVDSPLKNWLAEFESYHLDDGKVPRGTHPLMDATRHAVSMLEYARKQSTGRSDGLAHPEIAVI